MEYGEGENKRLANSVLWGIPPDKARSIVNLALSFVHLCGTKKKKKAVKEILSCGDLQECVREVGMDDAFWRRRSRRRGRR